MRERTYHVEHEVSGSHWWFSGRRRVLASLLGALELPPGGWVLDAGCGTGANAPILARHGRVVGVDASATALGLREEGRLCRGRLEALPFSERRFALVTALDLLEHLDDDLAGARELGRVLHPDGRLVVFVPAFELLWGLQDDVSHHRRRYTARSLRSVIERAGLEVERLSFFNTLLFSPILAARLAMRLHRPQVSTENDLTTPLLDRLLGAVFGAEAPVVARLDLPVGVSLLAVARRPR